MFNASSRSRKAKNITKTEKGTKLSTTNELTQCETQSYQMNIVLQYVSYSPFFSFLPLLFFSHNNVARHSNAFRGFVDHCSKMKMNVQQRHKKKIEKKNEF